jgi:hypothetical protein
VTALSSSAASAAGRITLRTALEDGALVFDVVDTGPGAPPGMMDALDEAGGGGLGLPVARRIARALGGDLVLAASGPGGSTFRLRLDAPVLACQAGHVSRRVVRSELLRTFALGGVEDADALRETLLAAGLQEAPWAEAALVVLDAGHADLGAALPEVGALQVALVLHQSEKEEAAAKEAAIGAGVAARTIHAPALLGAEALWVALPAALDIREALAATAVPSPPSSEQSEVASEVASTPAPTRATLRILAVDDNVRSTLLFCAAAS